MIGLDDGWKIYVGIVPYNCGGDDHEGLHHIKEGLPAIPSRGDFFRPSVAAYNEMEAVFGKKPCEGCDCKESGCWCHNYGRSPINYTSDCNIVKEVLYFQEEKEIIILLTCDESPVAIEPVEKKTVKKIRLLAGGFGKA